MPFGYDSDRVAAELQLQKRVRQAELALAKADRPLPQEPRVPSTREVVASPRSPHFGVQIQRANPLGHLDNMTVEVPPVPAGFSRVQGSGSPEFRQRVDAIRCRLQSLPEAQEAYEDLKSRLLEVQSQQLQAAAKVNPQAEAMPQVERSEDTASKWALEVENEDLIQRLRRTEIMTQEAAEAQIEADEQIDADFRNLEEKMQEEINDVAQEGIQLEEHWFQKVEELQHELTEAKMAPESTEQLQQTMAEELEARLAEMKGQDQTDQMQHRAEVQDLQNELREEKQISRRFATEEARAREEYQLQEEQKERFRRAQEQVQTKVQDLQNELREEKQISRRFATEEARAREEYQLQEEQKERFRRAQEQVQTKVQNCIKWLSLYLQNELREEKQISRRFATEEARAREEYQLQEEQKERFRRAQEQVQTKVQDLQNELREEKQISRRFATEEGSCRGHGWSSVEVEAKRKTVARVAEMQSEQQECLQQIAALQGLLEDEKQVGKLLVSQRMVAAKVQATVTQEMAEMSEHEESQAEQLQQLLLAESTWAEELLDLRCDLELKAATSRGTPRHPAPRDRRRDREATAPVPMSVANELAQLELALGLWDARIRSLRERDKDVELLLQAQLARAETKAMRFKGGQDFAEEQLQQLRSELDALGSAQLLAAAAEDRAALLEEELHAQGQIQDSPAPASESSSIPPSKKETPVVSPDVQLRPAADTSALRSWRKSWAPGAFQLEDLDQKEAPAVKLSRATLTPQSSRRGWRMSWSGV